jgi:hypothetical protein
MCAATEQSSERCDTQQDDGVALMHHRTCQRTNSSQDKHQLYSKAAVNAIAQKACQHSPQRHGRRTDSKDDLMLQESARGCGVRDSLHIGSRRSREDRAYDQHRCRERRHLGSSTV